MFTVIFLWLSAAGTLVYTFFCSWKQQQQTNKRPNEWQPNLGRQRLADESNHLSSTPHLSLSLPRSLSYPTISSPSVSLSTWQRLSAQSVCSGCVWTYACMCVSWLWARSYHRASMPVCYGPHMAAKCGCFGQGSCTFTSICKQITEKNNYSVWNTGKKSARMLS